ncbi:MAG: M23 family metallopeptidase [Thermoleophilia bacterium]
MEAVTMWKRMLMGCAVMVVLIFPLLVPAASNAACGVDPPLPPDGFSWPASGPVSTEWSLDCRTDRGHRGIDIAVAEGDPILASAAGIVVFAGYTPAEDGGLTISIEHEGGMRTTYLHLANVIVSQGQAVSKSQQLGSSDGSPLHFGMKVATARETYFNPVIWIAPLEMPSSSTGPPTETATGTESGPASSPAPAPEPSASQPSPGSAAAVPSSPGVESAMAMSEIIPEIRAGLITSPAPATAPGHGDISSGGIRSFPLYPDAETLPPGPEILVPDITANGATTPDADGLLTRFDDSADSSQGKSPYTAQSTRRPSTITRDGSPMRNLLLAGLLLMAGAGSGLLHKLTHQKPALGY